MSKGDYRACSELSIKNKIMKNKMIEEENRHFQSFFWIPYKENRHEYSSCMSVWYSYCSLNKKVRRVEHIIG